MTTKNADNTYRKWNFTYKFLLKWQPAAQGSKENLRNYPLLSFQIPSRSSSASTQLIHTWGAAFYLIKWLETTNPQNLQSLQLQNDNKLRYRLFLDLEELVSYWHLLLVHVCTCVLFFSNHESIFFPYAWLRIDGACSKIKLLSCWYAIPCSSEFTANEK